MTELLLSKQNDTCLQGLKSFMGIFAEYIANLVVCKLSEKDYLQKTIVLEQEPEDITKADFERYYTIKEVCEILGVKRGTVNNLRRREKLIPDFYVGRSPRYTQLTIQNYLNANFKEA